jgi:FPC/CPF motif-containing protein YcgG
MSTVLQNRLSEFVGQSKFPCVMAKALFSKGYVEHHVLSERDLSVVAAKILQKISRFNGRLRRGDGKPTSFIVSFDHPSLAKFEKFEEYFWELLGELDRLDKSTYSPDPRVSSDPQSPHFSFSVGGEGYFMLLLHPESPRFSRRFSEPTIVFNAHQQFEDLRHRGVYEKVRDLTRQRDIGLQGFINPMVSDHGGKSEVFQYTGRDYPPNARCPFHRGIKMLKDFFETSDKAA